MTIFGGYVAISTDALVCSTIFIRGNIAASLHFKRLSVCYGCVLPPRFRKPPGPIIAASLAPSATVFAAWTVAALADALVALLLMHLSH